LNGGANCSADVDYGMVGKDGAKRVCSADSYDEPMFRSRNKTRVKLEQEGERTGNPAEEGILLGRRLSRDHHMALGR